MGFKEILSKLHGKNKIKKEVLNQMETQMRAEKILNDRLKSANERELERFDHEEREELIKERLDFMRKKREKDIRFNHNPLDVKNITSGTQWEVLKEKNMFANKGFSLGHGDGNVLKNSNKLMKNNRSLYGI